MRELLSLRRNETPIIGEVYRYNGDYLKCVAGNGSAAEGCEKCYFGVEFCGGLCDVEHGARTRHHFEEVLESEVETAANVKFRHVEEIKSETPFVGERLIAAVGLVEYVEKPKNCLDECVLCDLTQRECDESSCGCGCFYRKVKQ